ncbi:hypothetical protein ACFXKS_38615 [Streptomyces scopuliridis]
MPVTFGGVTFRPGDILHADGDGIALLPRTTSASPSLSPEQEG